MEGHGALKETKQPHLDRGVPIGQVEHLPEMMNEGVVGSHGGPQLSALPWSREMMNATLAFRRVVLSLHLQDEGALEQKAWAG